MHLLIYTIPWIVGLVVCFIARMFGGVLTRWAGYLGAYIRSSLVWVRVLDFRVGGAEYAI